MNDVARIVGIVWLAAIALAAVSGLWWVAAAVLALPFGVWLAVLVAVAVVLLIDGAPVEPDPPAEPWWH